jgi:hypothetical protein
MINPAGVLGVGTFQRFKSRRVRPGNPDPFVKHRDLVQGDGFAVGMGPEGFDVHPFQGLVVKHRVLLVRRVYHFSQKKISVVEGADAPTFEVTSYDSATGTEARDKSARYMEGRRK